MRFIILHFGAWLEIHLWRSQRTSPKTFSIHRHLQGWKWNSYTLMNLSIMRKLSFDDERSRFFIFRSTEGATKLWTRKTVKDYFGEQIFNLNSSRNVENLNPSQRVFKRFRLRHIHEAFAWFFKINSDYLRRFCEGEKSELVLSWKIPFSKLLPLLCRELWSL